MLFKFRWYLSRSIIPNGTHINLYFVNKRDYDIRRWFEGHWRRKVGSGGRGDKSNLQWYNVGFHKARLAVPGDDTDECDSNLNIKRWLFGDKRTVFYSIISFHLSFRVINCQFIRWKWKLPRTRTARFERFLLKSHIHTSKIGSEEEIQRMECLLSRTLCSRNKNTN